MTLIGEPVTFSATPASHAQTNRPRPIGRGRRHGALRPCWGGAILGLLAISIVTSLAAPAFALTTSSPSRLAAPRSAQPSGEALSMGWVRRPAFCNDNLESVDFLDDQNGWVGTAGLVTDDPRAVAYHTTDGGLSWRLEPVAARGAVISVAAITPQIALAVVDDRRWPYPIKQLSLARTTDGGDTWAPVGLPEGSRPEKVIATDSTRVWAVGGRRLDTSAITTQILASTDAGATWAEKPTPDGGSLNDLTISDAGNGWAAGEDSTLLQTTDGGDQWVARDVGIDPDLIDEYAGGTLDYTRVFTHADATLTLFGTGSYDFAFVLGSTDGGDTWAISSSGLEVDFGLAAFSDADVGWTATHNGWERPYLWMLQLTTDGGTSWTPQGETLTFGRLQALDFTPGGGWLVGDNGALFSYELRSPFTDTTPPVTVSDSDHLWTNKTVVITFTATDDDSGVAQTLSEYGAWRGGSTLTIVVSPDETRDGARTIRFRSFDRAGNLESLKHLQLNVDVNGPTTFGARRVTVVRGRRPIFRGGVSDAMSMKADVTIEILAGDGRRVKRLSFGRLETSDHAVVELRPDWRCRLPRGRYSYTILATDLAGNPQKVAASARFIVK